MGSSGGELWLPEPAIERIQYFLNSIKAAQTTILSKSWYNVWSIRPNLDFDQADHVAYNRKKYGKKYGELDNKRMEEFLEFADCTLSRYEESNLKIQSFKLRMNINFYRGGRYCIDHIELIERALKIGATHLTINLSEGCVFPDEEFESAVTVKTCSNLQSRSLHRFKFESPDTISRILSCSPLIQHLSLDHVSIVKPYGYLYERDFAGYYGNYPTDDYGYITKPLMRLTTLVLKYVYFDMLFLGDLSSKFPLLKDLTLFMKLKKYQEEIRISSTSLECLNFKLKNIYISTRNDHPYKRQMVTLDFPSIRKFKYVGSVIPLLSLESNSRGYIYWESHLSIKRCHKLLTASWFRRLSDFLTKLRRSRVSLSLQVRSATSNINYDPGEIQGLPTCEIENLTIDHKELSTSLACYALLDVLFRICHPKSITQCVSKCFRVKKKHIELLGHTLLSGVVDREKIVLTPTHFMYGLNDLKEATAQIIDKSTASTRRDVHLPLDALLQHLKSSKGKQEVRFQLNWQPTTTTRKKFYMKMCNQKIQELDNNRMRDISAIEWVKHDIFVMEKMIETIVEHSGSGDLISNVKHLLRLILEYGFTESGNNVDDANKFCCLLHEVFREPCFVNALRAELEEAVGSIVRCAGNFSSENNGLPTERVARMKADLGLKPNLMSLRFDTTNFNTITVFLSILLAHWSDEGELRDLDKRTLVKSKFGRQLDIIYNSKTKRKNRIPVSKF